MRNWFILAFFVILVLPVFTFAQEVQGTSTVSLGAGGNFVTGGYFAKGAYSNSADVLLGYEYRVHRYIGVDLGYDNAFPQVTLYYSEGNFTRARVHNTFLPFGARAILPLANGRAELYGGGGGAYVWHGDYHSCDLCGGYPPALDGWRWQVNAGTRFALDSARRFWAGATVRYYRDGVGTSLEQNVVLTGDVGFRFGR